MKGYVPACAILRVLILVTFVVGPCAGDEYFSPLAPWPNHGAGLGNRRDAPFERKISTKTVASLSLKWTVKTAQDVTATPAIADEIVYFPSWGGNLYAVKQFTGEIIWEKNLTQLTAGVPEFANVTSLVLSRHTPTVAGKILIVGVFGPAVVLGLKRSTGALVWATRLSTHPMGLITQSPAFLKDSIYVGSSSLEEAGDPDLCCYFQGAFFKITAATGKIVWKVGMLPDNHGQQGLYAGAAVWGSSPPIDVRRRLVYIATGNSYTVPPDVEACELALQNQTNPPTSDPCLTADNHAESFLAINIDTGKIIWSRHLGGYDTWTFTCLISTKPSPNCPKIIGVDYDFGEEPMLVSTKTGRDIVVAGQKSGFVHALDRSTGKVVWQTAAGPGGLMGGASWGMTTDGERVFTNIINSLHKNFTLVPSTQVISWGGWVALNATTGAVLWSTSNPSQDNAISPLSHANGVVFGGSQGTTNTSGAIIALNSKTGKVLWSYKTNAGLDGGVSISCGCIFQGIGKTFGSAAANPGNRGNSTISLCVSG